MNLRTATALHRVFAGVLTSTESDNSTRIALGALLNARLVTHDTGDRGMRPPLHPDVDLLCEEAERPVRGRARPGRG